MCIEHKAITKNWDEKKSLETLSLLSEKTKIFWFDQADSSGTFLGQVLPYVEKYLKAQILTDKSLYKKSFYADRIYTDYYHLQSGVTDNKNYEYKAVEKDSDLEKIDISWNSSFMNHGYWGPYLSRILHYMPYRFLMHLSDVMGHPNSHRSMDLTCRMGMSYTRDSVRYQREQISKILKDRLATNKLSRKQYFQEMKDSKICASAFGYGEITLKDFESFLTGTALLKPNMDHMSTWPNLYEKDITYISHSWDLEDLVDVIETYIQDQRKAFSDCNRGTK